MSVSALQKCGGAWLVLFAYQLRRDPYLITNHLDLTFQDFSLCESMHQLQLSLNYSFLISLINEMVSFWLLCRVVVVVGAPRTTWWITSTMRSLWALAAQGWEPPLDFRSMASTLLALQSCSQLVHTLLQLRYQIFICTLLVCRNLRFFVVVYFGCLYCDTTCYSFSEG